MRILKSLLVIVTAVTAVAFGTLALYTDQAVSEGNVLGTNDSSIDIVLGGSGNESHPYFNVTNMIPGDTVTRCLVVYNAGSRDVLFRAYAVQTGGLKDLKSQLDITATLRPSSGICHNLNIGSYDEYGPSENPFTVNVPFTQFIGPDHALNNLDAAYNSPDGKEWPLKSHMAAVYEVNVTMDKDAGDEYKNASWQGNLVVDALQFDNISRKQAEDEWEIPHT